MSEQQNSQDLAAFVLEPPLRSAHITLGPDRHGLVERWDGQKVPRGNTVFSDGRYETRDAGEAEQLRRHPGNVENGGDLFREVDARALSDARNRANNGAMLPDGGLTEADTSLLADLVRLAGAERLPPKALPRAREVFENAAERFMAHGVRRPVDGDKAAVVQVRLCDLRDLLESSGIPLPAPAPAEPDEG